jgi:hypothetical protein
MTRKQSGLGRAELIWTATILTIVVVLIVNTLRSEVARAKERMCLDSLAYLSAQIHIGLEQLELYQAEQLSEYYHGSGNHLSLDGDGAVNDLSEVLLDDIQIPQDPWGNAFVLHKVKQGENTEFWLISGGENGLYPAQPFTPASLAKRVYLPFVSKNY